MLTVKSNTQSNARKTGYVTPKLTENELRQLKSQTGPNFESYSNYEMRINSANEENVPEPLRSWTELDLPSQILRNLIQLKMNVPTPIQRVACPGNCKDES